MTTTRAKVALDKAQFHHFTGCTKKIELVIDCIKKNMGERIIFSDVTWYVNRDNLVRFKDDLESYQVTTYARSSHVEHDLNIGLILLVCSPSELAFWETCLCNMSAHTHDQATVSALVLRNKDWIPMMQWPLVFCGLVQKREDVPMRDVCILKLFTPSQWAHRDRYTYRMQSLKTLQLKLLSDKHRHL